MTSRKRKGEDDLFTTLKGKQVVLYRGLLAKAHAEGLHSIRTEILQMPHPDNGDLCVVYATVHMRVDGEKTCRTFTGIGDASPQIKGNVGGMIAPHWIRMAETRAKARALRDAVNVGVVAMDELGDLMGEDEPQPQREAPQEPQQRTTRTRKLSPLTQAKREAMTAMEDVRLGNGGGMEDAAFLKKIAGIEYGADGADTPERVVALVEMVRAGAFDLATGDKLPEGV
jgi:hypothetical protein